MMPSGALQCSTCTTAHEILWKNEPYNSPATTLGGPWERTVLGCVCHARLKSLRLFWKCKCIGKGHSLQWTKHPGISKQV